MQFRFTILNATGSKTLAVDVPVVWIDLGQVFWSSRYPELALKSKTTRLPNQAPVVTTLAFAEDALADVLSYRREPRGTQ